MFPTSRTCRPSKPRSPALPGKRPRERSVTTSTSILRGTSQLCRVRDPDSYRINQTSNYRSGNQRSRPTAQSSHEPDRGFPRTSSSLFSENTVSAFLVAKDGTRKHRGSLPDTARPARPAHLSESRVRRTATPYGNQRRNHRPRRQAPSISAGCALLLEVVTT